MDEFLLEGLTSEAGQLLSAAVESFSTLGYNGTTTRLMAKSVRRSPAAVYTHYSSKHELLFQIIIRGHRNLLELILSACASSDDPVAQLSAIARTHAEFHARHVAIARIANYELHNLNADAMEQVLEVRHEIENQVRAIIAHGISTGAFDVDDGTLVGTALLSMGIDVSRWYHGSGRLTIEQIGEGYAEFARRMVGYREAASNQRTRPTRARGVPR